MKYARSNQGFTLLEVMVGLAILAGMCLGIFISSQQILQSKEDTELRDEAYHGITLALNRIADDIGMAILIKSKELLGQNFDGELQFDGSEERIDFVSFSNLRFIQDAKEGELSEISYFLEPMPDAERNTKKLMRRASPVIDKDLQQGGRAFTLVENIERMRFEYLDEKSGEFKKEWKTKSVDTGNKLPQAVKISIEVKLPGEEEKKTFSTLAVTRLNNGVLSF